MGGSSTEYNCHAIRYRKITPIADTEIKFKVHMQVQLLNSWCISGKRHKQIILEFVLVFFKKSWSILQGGSWSASMFLACVGKQNRQTAELL